MNDSHPTNSFGDDQSERTPLGRDSQAPPDRIGRYRIERELGEGGFGVVYLARDDELQRLVAIKVPHRHVITRVRDADLYLTEARTAARLDHPHIVPVHDVGHTDEFPCFIVSKYIDGTDLAQYLRENRLTFQAAAELVATIAEALHHAHCRGLVHRDIKPGNILLDQECRPYITDFGLALREEDTDSALRFAGTPAYMSPEQARGEGHRVDGRSDIFSLGVVLYQLLTGHRPFQAQTDRELRELIIRADPTPPRQRDDRVPHELERICLKALARRAADRYSTGQDFADDLRHLLKHTQPADRHIFQTMSPPAPVATPVPTPAPTAPSSPDPLRIVPKGLRSFDALDADFFLELLSGPRDRDGLPDSLRFWKTRIEDADPDNSFAVGLIYGPSGCGKSSLMKAGLLPRLANHVEPIFVEATAGETESRLLIALRKRFPGLPESLSLTDMLAVLRRGHGLAAGKKLLIVIDQFEQWLHARRDRDDELVQALRQCDSGRVQSLLLVRDDFWLAVSRFLRELEVDLVPGRNVALADLFDLDHARKVLAAFGRAFGRLPADGAAVSREQRQFLNHAVSGLATDGKVICVRLALFAEMMKGRPWTATELRHVGGAEGIGVAFLEESFSSPSANPLHRLHQNAARAVLQTLLPECAGNIKGNMRSREQLLAASGYAGRPRDFDELLRILDGQTRLITPTDPEGSDIAPPIGGGPYYQLTHDYLVGPLREWLTRKQKETRQGRAELLLAERTALWETRPQTRFLPSALEWLQIRLFTRPRHRTAPQRRLLHAADLHHLTRTVWTVALLTVALASLGEFAARSHSRELLAQLNSADVAEVPAILTDLKSHRRRLEPRLREALANETDERKQLVLRLALAESDPQQVQPLMESLLSCRPADFAIIRRILSPHQADLIEPLWATLTDGDQYRDRRFRAACALAEFAPTDPRWTQHAAFTIETLAGETESPHWRAALKPARDQLVPALADALEHEKWTGAERRTLVNIFRDFAHQAPATLRILEERFAKALPGETETEKARRQARIAAALATLDRGERVWPLLKHSHDPTLRSFLIEELGEAGIDPQILVKQLFVESDSVVRSALILALGAFRPDQVRNYTGIVNLYISDDDPGVHGAIGWLLRRWGRGNVLAQMDSQLASGAPKDNRRWYVSRHPPHQSFAVLEGPGTLAPRRDSRPHRFAIAMTEVTIEQFQAFQPNFGPFTDERDPKRSPVSKVTWLAAAQYCNWLSRREGLQECYREADGKWEFEPDYLDRNGYRLPTFQEWMFACLAGASTKFSFGHPDTDLASSHCWWVRNSFGELDSQASPVGLLKPNAWGLFDMHGNVSEWCQESKEDQASLGTVRAPVRGGHFTSDLLGLAIDSVELPRTWFRNLIGFRVVRTLP